MNKQYRTQSTKPAKTLSRFLNRFSARTKLAAALVVLAGAAAASITTAATAATAGTLTNPAGKCLTNKNNSTANNNPAIILTCSTATGQQWMLASNGTIQTQGRCLDTYRQRKTNGTQVVVNSCSTNASQKWVLNSNKTIRNTASGRCLDSTGSMSVDGNTMLIANCDSAAKSQQWTLNSTPAPTPTPTPTPPAPTPTPPAPTPSTSMLTRNGPNLMLNGAVYKSGSVNNFTLTGCHYGYVPTDAELDDFFSRLQPNTLVRTWAFEQQGETNISRVVDQTSAHIMQLM